MRFGIFFVAVALAMTIGLPLYLGPDDIAGCQSPSETGKCQKVDAIVAVSGGDTMARTDEAIKLYKAGWAPLLVFSGAAADKKGPSNAKVMRERALHQNVPSKDILTDETSATTAENAQNTASIVKNRSIKRLLLVTSAYHQRRAGIEFNKQLGGAAEVVNHPVANDNQWSSWWWMTPYGWVLGVGEIIKIIIAEAS